MGFIDASVTALALPALRADLGASQTEVEWVGAAYLLTLSATILTGGAMGDRFGTLRLFRAGIWGFMAASTLSALAPGAGLLIAARALQGLAGAAMVPGSMALIARSYPPEARGRALGLWAAFATATTMAGPVLGGAILSLGPAAAWRLIFALNLPFGLAALGLLARHARPDPGRPGAPIDLGGACLATLALGALAAGLSLAPGPMLGPVLALAGAAGLAFLRHEARHPAPMLPLSLFRLPGFAGVNAATLLLYTAVTGLNFYLPTAAQTGWHLAPWQVTLALLPVSTVIALLSPLAGTLADRIGPGPVMASGAAVVALAQGLMAALAASGPFWSHVWPPMLLSGLGMSLVVAPLTAAVMAPAPEGQQGAASGVNNAMARVATLIAIAGMGRLARGEDPGFGSAAGAASAPATLAHLAAWAASASALAALITLWTVRRAPTRWPGDKDARRHGRTPEA